METQLKEKEVENHNKKPEWQENISYTTENIKRNNRKDSAKNMGKTSGYHIFKKGQKM